VHLKTIVPPIAASGLMVATIVLAVVEIAMVLAAGALLVLADAGWIQVGGLRDVLGAPHPVTRGRIAAAVACLALLLLRRAASRARPASKASAAFDVIAMLVLADAFWRPAVHAARGGLVLALGALMAALAVTALAPLGRQRPESAA